MPGEGRVVVWLQHEKACALALEEGGRSVWVGEGIVTQEGGVGLLTWGVRWSLKGCA